MGCVRANNVWFCDTLAEAKFTIGEHGKQDRLGTARSENATRFIITVVHIANHTDNLCLLLSDSFVLIHVKSVCVHKSTHNFINEVPVFLVVDVDTSTDHTIVAAMARVSCSFLDILHNLSDGNRLLRDALDSVCSLLLVL